MNRNAPKRLLAGVVAPIRRRRARNARNQPCHCGSGAKFKKCCGSNRDRFEERTPRPRPQVVAE
jgi:hypothetical protein